MGRLKKDSTPEFVAALKALEDQADECYKKLHLLRMPRNFALWSLLTATVTEVEKAMARWGPDSQHFLAALLKMSFICPVLTRWITRHGRPGARLVTNYHWTETLGHKAAQDLGVAHHYFTFLTCFPMWHKDRLLAELRAANLGRFTVPGGGRDRQLSAYHKGFRPRTSLINMGKWFSGGFLTVK